MRLAAPLAIIALSALLLAGCGGSGGEDSAASTQPAAPPSKGSGAPPGASAHECGGPERLRATGLGCKEARALVAAWGKEKGCAPAGESSRSACSLRGSYQCLGVATERGISVSCARPGSSIAFTAKPG